jgi:hypothetical protein
MNSSAAFYSTMVGRHKGSTQGKEQRWRREKKDRERTATILLF